MEFKKVIIQIFVVTAFAGTALAQDSSGGNSGGGGNVKRSTLADLEVEVKEIISSIWYASDDYTNGHANPLTQKPLKPELQKITQKILQLPYFSVTRKVLPVLRENLNFKIQNEACIDNGEEKDGSTKDYLGAPICLSADRLSRYPRETLKIVLLPLVFHELAHQYKFGEKQANAFQDLAAIHFQYLRAYVNSVRAMLACGGISSATSIGEIGEVLSFAKEHGGFVDEDGSSTAQKYMEIMAEYKKTEMQHFSMYCAATANLTSQDLEHANSNQTNGWRKVESGLNDKQLRLALNYHGGNKEFSFFSMIFLLKEPAWVSVSGCEVCRTEKVDPAYLMFLGSKAAANFIESEVARLQDQIDIK